MTFRPYRIVVSSTRYRPIKRYKRHTAVERIGVGWVAWNPVQYYREARLPSAGSFLWPGVVEARKAAMNALAIPNVHQVAVKTNQDKTVYRYFKHDRNITGYGGSD
jgi:hypothetical protein